MKEDNLKSNLKLFEEIFKREALEYHFEYIYFGSEEYFKWGDKKLQEMVESNSTVNQFLKYLIDYAKGSDDDRASIYIIKTTVFENLLGFRIDSGYDNSCLDGFDQEGETDPKTLYNDEFINQLNSIELLNALNKENLNEFLNFKLNEDEIFYLKIYDSEQKKWINWDETKVGKEISDILYDFYNNNIIYKLEDEYLLEGCHSPLFTENFISYFTEGQMTIQDNVFIPLNDLIDEEDIKEELI
tara:strand:+ start:1841 stop:2569 length:729 start_codon:yes stop_codon:yes gene_type:complete